MLLVGEAEAMEGEGLWVILGALHEAANGRASPLARVHRGPIGERKGLQRRATRAHCEVFASVVEEKRKGGGGYHALDSTGVRRADSLMKLSRSGRPLAVRSKSAYPAASSCRRG